MRSAVRMASATDAGTMVASALWTDALGRSVASDVQRASICSNDAPVQKLAVTATQRPSSFARSQWRDAFIATGPLTPKWVQSSVRSEEHTSELQSRLHLVFRLLLEKKKKKPATDHIESKIYSSLTPEIRIYDS